jgi:DNA mismatch repair protein MSH6
MSRRNSNGRSPLVNPQRQITSFFTKTPSPSLSKTIPKPNPNPIPNPITNTNPNPSPTLTTPSPLNPKKPHKPRLVIGASPTPTTTPPPPSSSHSHFIGKRIKVYWPLDDAWYEGVVKSFDAVTNKHRIRYDDDEEESIDISKEKIEWLQDNSSKKLKRLRRSSSPIRKMVIEDNEVEGSPKEEKKNSTMMMMMVIMMIRTMKIGVRMLYWRMLLMKKKIWSWRKKMRLWRTLMERVAARLSPKSGSSGEQRNRSL